MSSPDVSIVLIAFNDEHRLPRAIASLRDQTLANLEIIVVDDASTDGTPAVIEAAMAQDPRIRAIRLEANSGGCSRPRNAGIEAARAPWVMFCDSDDAMERHAAKTLLLAAERGECDLACGVAERVDVATGERVRWKADLHEPAVLRSIDERPALIADTVSVNKLYRRAFLDRHGIRFPEGILYEDQRFTFEALALADGIAVLDDTVYEWSVARLAEEPSITQRRAELRNVRDRIAVNRLIDEAIEARGLERLRPAKDAKFLAHDLYLHLVAAFEAEDDATARAIMDELAPYAATVDPDAAAGLRPALRVALFHLLIGDLGHLRSAMRAVRWAAAIDVPIVESGGRELWACGHEHGDGALGRPASWWLDVSALRIRRAPIAALRPCHLLEASGPALAARGSSPDITGLGLPDAASGALVSGDRVLWTCGAQVRAEGDRWQWELDGRWRPAVADAALAARSGVACLALRFGDETVLQPLRTATAPELSWRVRGASFRTGAGEHGAVAWHRTTAATRRRALRRIAARVAGAIARRMPARGIALWSLEGRGTGDAMLALAERLPEARWVVDRDPETVPGSLDARTARGARALGRAKVVVVDAGLPPGLRAGATVVRLQSDVPVVRSGRDAPDWDLAPPRQRVPAMVRRWSAIALPSEHAARAVADAIEAPGERLVTGSLRGERVASTDRERARRRLGLRGDRGVVLWAPCEPDPVDPDRDLERSLLALVDELGDDAFVVVRARRRLRIPAALRSSARDASTDGDAATALAACDALVTDASPLAFDAVRAGIPVVAWSPRFAAIDRESGFAVPPASLGAVAGSAAECGAAVRDALAGRGTAADPGLLALAGPAGGSAELAAWIRRAAGGEAR